MNVIQITSASDPRIKIFASLTEAELRKKSEYESGLFIAESPKVIKIALDKGYEPVALLCETKHIEGDAAQIIERSKDIPIYTGSREILATITGYKLTRGVLCAMRRPKPVTANDILQNARRVAVVDGVCDTTNIGAIFRSAAALGIDAILLTDTTCDPLNRRCVRVSMGSIFLIPWAWIDDPQQTLNALGFKTLAMALRPEAIPINNPILKDERKLAIILGTEGDGLMPEVIEKADYKVIIPMHNNVDSLNVATAAAIAFWELRANT